MLNSGRVALREAMQRFLDDPHLLNESIENDQDELALRAIQGRSRPSSDREQDLEKWLRNYAVLMGFTTQGGLAVAAQIIKFSDENQTVRFDGAKSIADAFAVLYERIHSVAPTTRSGKQRSVTSLTSKALWCCFPSSVPIYDGYAAHALQVLSRLFGVGTNGQSTYPEYLDVWFRFYEEIEPILERRNLQCEKVRVFDRFLWYIGAPEFLTSAAHNDAIP